MIRAMVLAAGHGQRLGEVTADLPKPMIPLAGKPILEHTIGWLARSGVSEITINLHHQADRIRGHFGNGSRFGVAICYSYEPTLLGTAGALGPVRDRFNSTFLVAYGDNFYDCDFERILAEHRREQRLGTMALFARPDVSQSGVARLGPDGTIAEFVEKPACADAAGGLVNAGLLLWEPGVFRYIPDGRPSDFSRDVIPALMAAGERMHGYVMRESETLLWVDRPEDLAAAQRIARERLVAR
jgi:NDP-sugar pyrophosphorylase family protein